MASGTENKRQIIEREIRNIKLQQGKQLREIELPSEVYDAGREFVKSAPNFNSKREPVRFRMIHSLPLGNDSIYEALQASVKDTLTDEKNIEEWQSACKKLLTYAQNLILAPQRPEFRRVKLSNSHYVYNVSKKFKRGDEILMCMGYSPGKTTKKGDEQIVQDLEYGGGRVITQQVVDTAVDLVVLHCELELIKGRLAREGASVYDLLHHRSEEFSSRGPPPIPAYHDPSLIPHSRASPAVNQTLAEIYKELKHRNQQGGGPAPPPKHYHGSHPQANAPTVAAKQMPNRPFLPPYHAHSNKREKSPPVVPPHDSHVQQPMSSLVRFLPPEKRSLIPPLASNRMNTKNNLDVPPPPERRSASNPPAKSANFPRSPHPLPPRTLPPNPDELPRPVVNHMQLEAMHANAHDSHSSSHYMPSFQDSRSLSDHGPSGSRLENLMESNLPSFTPSPGNEHEINEHWRPIPQLPHLVLPQHDNRKPSSTERMSDSSEDLYNSGSNRSSAPSSLEAHLPEGSPSKALRRAGHDSSRYEPHSSGSGSSRAVAQSEVGKRPELEKHHSYESDEAFIAECERKYGEGSFARQGKLYASKSKPTVVREGSYESDEAFIAEYERKYGEGSFARQGKLYASKSKPTVIREGSYENDEAFIADYERKYGKGSFAQQEEQYSKSKPTVADIDYKNDDTFCVQSTTSASIPDPGYVNHNRELLSHGYQNIPHPQLTSTDEDEEQTYATVVFGQRPVVQGHGYGNVQHKPPTTHGYANIPRKQPTEHGYINFEADSEGPVVTDDSPMSPSVHVPSERNDMNYDASAAPKSAPPRNIKRQDMESFTPPWLKQDGSTQHSGTTPIARAKTAEQKSIINGWTCTYCFHLDFDMNRDECEVCKMPRPKNVLRNVQETQEKQNPKEESKQLEFTDSEVTKAKASNQDLSNQLEAAHHKLTTIKATNQKLSNQLETSKHELTQTKDSNQKLSEQLESANHKIAGMEVSIKTVSERIENISQELTKEKHSNQQLTQTNLEHTRTNQQLAQQLETANGQLAKFQAENERSSHDIEPWKVSCSKVEMGAEIARGGWGMISKGKVSVAIKEMHSAIVHQSSIDQFHREMQILSQVCHPNLVQFIGAVFDQENGRPRKVPLILIELLDVNLRKAYEEGRLRGDHKLSIFKDVAKALKYLHERYEPIIHRDVSAPNVLLEALPEGNWKGKLSDLGSANYLKHAQTHAPGAILYAAPETFPTAYNPDAPPVAQTFKLDVYSFGVMLCEVMTNRFPEKEDYADMLRQVQRSCLPMYNLIRHCTEFKQESRPEMAAVLSTLDNVPRLP